MDIGLDSENTMYFNGTGGSKNSTREILEEVYKSLEEKGYDPVSQIVGYLISGDPAYITSYNNARNLMKKIERDDLIEELVKFYLEG